MKQVDNAKIDGIKSKFKEMFRRKSFKELLEETKQMEEDWKKTASMMPKITNPFGKKCPKCDSRNVKVLKPSFTKKWGEASIHAFTLGLGKLTPNLNVCRDCGFSWEDR